MKSCRVRHWKQLATSSQSNLTTGRIAAAHGRFIGIRQVRQCAPDSILPWAHQSPNRKRHLDRFSHLCTKHWWPILSAWYTCNVDAYSTLCVTLQCDCIVSHRMVLYSLRCGRYFESTTNLPCLRKQECHHDAACHPRFRAIGSHM